MAKFTARHETIVRTATVEIGRRSNAPAFKITTAAGTYILTEAEAEDLADALDESIAVFEGDPLLWEAKTA